MSSWNNEWEEGFPEVRRENDTTASIPLMEYHDLIVDARTWYARAVEQIGHTWMSGTDATICQKKVEKFEKFLSENEEIRDEFDAWKKGTDRQRRLGGRL